MLRVFGGGSYTVAAFNSAISFSSLCFRLSQALKRDSAKRRRNSYSFISISLLPFFAAQHREPDRLGFRSLARKGSIERALRSASVPSGASDSHVSDVSSPLARSNRLPPQRTSAQQTIMRSRLICGC